MTHFKKVFFFFILSLAPILTQAQTTCTVSPDFSKLSGVFLEYLYSETKKEDPIAILPFYDNSTTKKDPLLAQSIPYAFYDFLAQKNENIFHPYLSFAVLKKLKINDSDLSLEETAFAVAKELKARFVIYGSVQRTLDGQMRFFIYIFDNESKETKNNRIEFSTLLNDLFFQNIKTGLKSALKDLNLKKNTLNSLKTYPSLQAFRYYVKGLNLASEYNEGSLKLAQVWFEKSLKESYFADTYAALAMARANYMLSLIQRFSAKDPSFHWVEGQRFLLSYGKVNLKKPTPREKIIARFYRNQEFFVKAHTYYKNKHTEKAYETAMQGLNDVPEDGQLYTIYKKSNGTGAKKYSYYAICF